MGGGAILRPNRRERRERVHGRCRSRDGAAEEGHALAESLITDHLTHECPTTLKWAALIGCANEGYLSPRGDQRIILMRGTEGPGLCRSSTRSHDRPPAPVAVDDVLAKAFTEEELRLAWLVRVLHESKQIEMQLGEC